MNEQQLEARINELGLNAPRIRPADVDAVISDVTYTTLPSGKVMVCELTLRNGFTVRGEAAAVSKENFSEEIGKEVSYKNAREQIWQLEGYLLQQRLRENAEWGDKIAELCHEVNRAYCQALGDDSQPSWDEAPDWQKQSARMGVAMHLATPDAGPEASHEGWLKHKEAEGWVYGEVKDPDAKTHPCMVPFEQLPMAQQAKDYIFRAIVHTVAKQELDNE